MTHVMLDPIVDRALKILGIRAEILSCDPELADTAAFCEHYGFSLDQAANTILVASKKIEPIKFAVCVVLATTRLDVNNKVSQMIGAKRLSFADAETTMRQTGMMIGGVTAIGISNLPIFVDSAVMDQPQVVMGGGNRSSKLKLDPRELLKLTDLQVVDGLALRKAE